jgi:hypothetical protein
MVRYAEDPLGLKQAYTYFTNSIKLSGNSIHRDTRDKMYLPLSYIVRILACNPKLALMGTTYIDRKRSVKRDVKGDVETVG